MKHVLHRSAIDSYVKREAAWTFFKDSIIAECEKCWIINGTIILKQEVKEGGRMDEQREKHFLRVISLKGSRYILKYLDEHDITQHGDLDAFMNTVTLNTRLKELLELGLVEHHLDKTAIRKEWYSITEKGKKIKEYLESMIELINSGG